MAFGQGNLLTSNVNAFLMESALQWYIHARTPAPLLKRYAEVGVHTDVFIFHQDTPTERYTWSHPGLRAFGTPILIQCPNSECMAIKPWRSPKTTLNKNKTEVLAILLKCAACGLEKVYELPEGLKRYGKGEISKGSEGEWYLEILDF
jgi:hypothetical protein